MRHYCNYLILTLFFAFALVGPASAQDLAEAEKLQSKAYSLFRAGKLAEATALIEQVLAIQEKQLGSGHAQVSTTLNNLALLYKSQGRLADAAPLYQRSLASKEKVLGTDHPEVAKTLTNLGALRVAQGRYSDAERLYKRSLEILEKSPGADGRQVATALNNLAALYKSWGRYADAERLFKRGNAILEQLFGPESAEFGVSLSNLAALYQELDRGQEAEKLFLRSLAIAESVNGPDHLDVGQSLNNLATFYFAEGNSSKAEALFKRTLKIFEATLGKEHSMVAAVLNNLAEIYAEQERFAEAEPLHKRAFVIKVKVFGSQHPDVALSLNNLAGLYAKQDRFDWAEPLFLRSLKISEKTLGGEHPWLATTLRSLARIAVARGEYELAAKYLRRATSILSRRAERGISDARRASTKREASGNRFTYESLIKTTYRLVAEESTTRKQYANETFEAAQWGVSSSAASSLAQMAARSASGSSELAALVRERQDLIAEWRGKERLLISARGRPPANRSPVHEEKLRDRLAAIDTRLTEIDARFAQDFLDFATLTSPAPMSSAEVQANLRSDEALVLFLDTDDRIKPLPGETFVWVVTRTQMRWFRSDTGTAALQRDVSALRCGLDATTWEGDEGTSQCAELLNLTLNEIPFRNDPRPFDPKKAHALYKSLLGKAEDLIKGKQLLVVPSGALTKLPFQVLVTEPSQANTPLRKIGWLARDHAVTVLPSVASLKSLRRVVQPSRADRRLIGFGNPLLDGRDERFKQSALKARGIQNCRDTTSEHVASLIGLRGGVQPVPTSRGLADLSHLKIQAPLPETAEELCAVAKELGANVREVRLGAKATEAEIKRLDARGSLAHYQIIHFATHGTLAGQLLGTTEPGLILTPPDKPTQHDDGYLSGSEIAALKLDADWVILSACNTAGGSDEINAEALSGLARVFFYAGARALLVSHWAVYSDATVKLIKNAVRQVSGRSVGRAEALRRAMLDLIDNGAAHESHPSYWAPFVVVGEGAAGMG